MLSSPYHGGALWRLIVGRGSSMAAKDSLITVGRQLIDKLYFSFGVEKFGSASKTLFGNNKYQDRYATLSIP